MNNNDCGSTPHSQEFTSNNGWEHQQQPQSSSNTTCADFPRPSPLIRVSMSCCELSHPNINYLIMDKKIVLNNITNSLTWRTSTFQKVGTVYRMNQSQECSGKRGYGVNQFITVQTDAHFNEHTVVFPFILENIL